MTLPWSLPRLRARVGLGVGRHAMRGVLVQGDRVVRAATVAIDSDGSLVDAVGRLLEEINPPRWPRPVVVAAIGPAAAQLRRLTRLPAIRDIAELEAITREHVSRFFLKNGVPLMTTGARRTACGDVWVGAIEGPVVRGLAEACGARDLCLAMAVPTLVALPAVLDGDLLQWRDGEVLASMTRTALGEHFYSRRLVADEFADQSVITLRAGARDAMQALGQDACAYADAYGATQLASGESLALQVRPSLNHLSVPTARRVALTAGLLFAACGAALAAAPLSARRTATVSHERLTRLDSRYRYARWLEADLEATTNALEALDRFARERRSMTLFLADITQGLPGDASLSSLRFDGQGGTLVVIAPRVAESLSEVARLRNVVALTVVGTVTAELQGGARLERATIRFHWRARTVAARSSSPHAGSRP